MILIFCADGANSPRHARVVFPSSLSCRPSLSLLLSWGSQCDGSSGGANGDLEKFGRAVITNQLHTHQHSPRPHK